MYRGFDLTLDWDNQEYYRKGLSVFNKVKNDVEADLKEFIDNDGIIDGSNMQESWFPEIKAHIFISHSHTDERKAITLAGWLHETFGIIAFIDSCIWGYSNDLLKIIDDKYCLNPSGETYNYSKRNYSTSHIHMILATALSKIIDKTECLFFMNTPSSISANSVVTQTESPWIYHELSVSEMIRKQIPRRLKVKEMRYFAKGGVLNESLRIKYDASLDHLEKLDVEMLSNWGDKKCSTPEAALDKLYEICPISGLQLLND